VKWRDIITDEKAEGTGLKCPSCGAKEMWMNKLRRGQTYKYGRANKDVGKYECRKCGYKMRV
tara:strand:+ start:76 stop:261 length:186 start_codon:yes stop_codon:yes gene_type:complete